MKNILIIGETGTGKSSVVNLTCGQGVPSTAESVEKCTFTIDKYEYGGFRLPDTVGYNDTEEKNGLEALKNLAKFVVDEDFKADGISLIVYVMKKGIITATSKKNYDYFVNDFCENQVPVLLVVTHCVPGSADQSWCTSQNDAFEELGLIFNDAVCGCAIDTSNPVTDSNLVSFSCIKSSVENAIGSLTSGNPWQPSDRKRWVVNLFIKTIRSIVVDVAIGTILEALKPILAPPVIVGIALEIGIGTLLGRMSDPFPMPDWDDMVWLLDENTE